MTPILDDYLYTDTTAFPLTHNVLYLSHLLSLLLLILQYHHSFSYHHLPSEEVPKVILLPLGIMISSPILPPHISNLTLFTVHLLEFHYFLTTLNTTQDPIHFKAALHHPYWKAVMNTELEALENNHIWDVTHSFSFRGNS